MADSGTGISQEELRRLEAENISFANATWKPPGIKENGEVSALESTLRGGAQGITLGQGANLTGAASGLQAALLPTPYDVEKYAPGKGYFGGIWDRLSGETGEARKATREANIEARKAHPAWFGVGEIGGGLMLAPLGAAGSGTGVVSRLVPKAVSTALSPAAKGATIWETALNAAGKAAPLGGLVAEGVSESETLGGKVADVLKGGAGAAVAAGVLTGIAGRAAKKLEREDELALLGGMSKQDQATMIGKDAAHLDNLGEFAETYPEILQNAKVDPRVAADIARSKIDDLMGRTHGALELVDRQNGPLERARLASEVLKEARDRASHYSKGQGAKMVAEVNKQLRQYGDLDMTTAELRRLTTEAGDRVNQFSSKLSNRVNRDIAGSFRSALDKHVEQALAADKNLAAQAGITAQGIRDANREISKLIAVKAGLENSAFKAAKSSTGFQLPERMSLGPRGIIRGAVGAVRAAPRVLGQIERAAERRGLRGGVAKAAEEGIQHEARNIAIDTAIGPELPAIFGGGVVERGAAQGDIEPTKEDDYFSDIQVTPQETAREVARLR